MQVHSSCCGLLCQHPSCWYAHRTKTKSATTVPGEPSSRTSYFSDDSDGLPKQTVVNLLGDFEEESMKTNHSKRPHSHLTSLPACKSASNCHGNISQFLPYERSVAEESSFYRLRAPHATPASGERSSTSLSISGQSKSNHHHEITKPAGEISQVVMQEILELEDLRKQQDQNESQQYMVWVPGSKRKSTTIKLQRDAAKKDVSSSNNVAPKDLTEDMMPVDVEWQREAMKMRKLQSHTPHSQEKGASRQPSLRGHFQGIYELLDLPKEVLSVLLQHINERDMLDRQQFAEALMQTLPRLERHSKSLALAHSRVLRQRKMPIVLGGPGARQHSLSPKQLYLVEDPMYQSLSELHQPALIHTPSSPDSRSPSPGRMATRPLVPDITPLGRQSTNIEESRIASISLGLPEIPSGVKHTRPFAYENKNLDFTLGPVEPVPIVSHRKAESISGSEHSTLHVTVPSVPSDPDQEENTDDKREDSCRDRLYTSECDVYRRQILTYKDSTHTERPLANYGVMSGAEWETTIEQQIPLHLVSPSHSTHVPRAPFGTPATRHNSGNTFAVEGISPMRAAQENLSQAPPQLISTEHTGILGTIHESASGNVQVPHPVYNKSRRSVRFASDVPLPPQPPSSPDSGVSPSRPDASLEAASMGVVCPSHDTDRQQNRSPTDIKINNEYISTSPAPSLEPWPQVTEEDYNPGNASLLGDRNSASLHHDARSELSDSTTRPNVLLSRESSRHSASAKMLLHDMGESPAPPPPSPEPKDMAAGEPERSDSAMVNILNDFTESESVITLSAKPPSNIDDLSRINTPINTPVCHEISTDSAHVIEAMLRPSDASCASHGSTASDDKTAREREENDIDKQNTQQATFGEVDMPVELSAVESEDPETKMSGTTTGQEDRCGKPLLASPLLSAQPAAHTDGQDEELQQGIAQLEQFETTDDNLMQELKDEYSKLEADNSTHAAK